MFVMVISAVLRKRTDAAKAGGSGVGSTCGWATVGIRGTGKCNCEQIAQATALSAHLAAAALLIAVRALQLLQLHQMLFMRQVCPLAG